MSRRRRDPVLLAQLSWWLRGVVAAGVLLLLGFSVYFLNYLPFVAARTYLDIYREPGPLDQRLALAQDSFDVFPSLASKLRVDFLQELTSQYNSMRPEARKSAVEFVAVEMLRGMEADPRNARVLATGLSVLQATAVPRKFWRAWTPYW